MFSEVIKATLMGALPVAIFTFLVLQWSIASGRFSGFDDEEDLGKQFQKKIKEKKEAQKQARAAEKAAQSEASKAASEANTDQVSGGSNTESEPKARMARRFAEDALHNTFARFGAGFYGTMAMITYLLIEVDEIFTFLGKLADLSWQLPDFISLFIDFLINSLMNFIAALVWFATLQDYLPIEMGFVWLVAAYLGYLTGERVTASYGDELWEHLKTLVSSIYAAGVKFAKDVSKSATSSSANDSKSDQKGKRNETEE